ncbi:MAG: isopenicillin N synthase family oxygenase [Acidobacteria bacterium]|nr:isopenicillin N synthase family oxygenase [Acidobacteriota bacterium]
MRNEARSANKMNTKGHGVTLESIHGGCVYVRHPLFPEPRCHEAIASAREFFALAPAEKERLAIARSPHFRGYSEMRNERDWREQIHFGHEEPAAAGTVDPCEQLRGPNLWPGDPGWRRKILELLADLEQAGRDVLATFAHGAGMQGDDLLPSTERPYLLLKLIHYLEPPAGRTSRSGVAPHVDFSWLTLILQDETGGLETRTPEGVWMDVPPVPGTLVLHIGEVLQLVSRGRYPATPHRVVNRPGSGSRVSLPFFLNPALDRWIEPAKLPESPVTEDSGHVHRVFAPSRREPFRFGSEEWRRKGLGVWCAACVSGASAKYE